MENIFYQRLNNCVKQTRKSYNQIERELGYARNALHNYKYSGEPSATRLIEIARYFDISPEYLLGLTPTVVPLIENIFQELDDNGKKDMCVICHKWLMREK
ncbi:XRE family transcriptional regulator [Lactococcus lactis]|uniref:XRE family transcriptional regulator n=1 Tax=Lactococcus lactis TaxID=1358 RepID=UPI0038781AF0